MNEQWHEERRKGIGGSDLASMFSLEPFGCRMKLWYEKRGIEPDEPFYDNPHMQRGRALEGIIADLYASLGYPTCEAHFGISREFPHIRGNADRFIALPKGATKIIKSRGAGVLECKCPARNSFKYIKRNGLPESWILQMQHYLYVYDLKWGAFAVLWAEGWEFITFEVERDDEMIGMIVEECHKFWKLVENGPAPDKLDPHDKRCKSCNRRKTCQGIDLIVEPDDSDDGDYVRVEGERGLELAQREYLEACEIVKEAEELKDERKERLIQLLDGRQAVITPIGKTSWSQIISNRWDTRRLEAEKPDLIQQYKKQYVTQRLFMKEGN